MAIIKCKMCGGDVDISVDKTFGVCEYCGSNMTFPRIDDDQRAAAFNRGNHFRRIGEFDKALAVYERIVREDDTDAEAHWCCALCRFGIEYVEDPVSLEWIPTCHRVSFDSFLEDVDYLAALAHSDGITHRQYQKDGAKIAEVQRGILATSQNAEPYDVFICYKETDSQGQRTRDSLLAQDIYYQLTEQGRKVFFSRITLEDVAGTQYEPYIFAALNSARVMVVVGTKTEHLNAVWVKNEWSRFLTLMKKDHTRLLLPCYRDMDPYDLPEQLSVLQSYDMGKIGFIQDLIRGISKVLDSTKKAEPTRDPVIMQSNSNAVALLKRGNIALEDSEWSKAGEYFDQVLNLDAECAPAYLGLVLASCKCNSLESFVTHMTKVFTDQSEQKKQAISPDTKHIQQFTKEYAISSYLPEDEIRKLYEFDLSYPCFIAANQKNLDEAKAYIQNNRDLARAIRYTDTNTGVDIQNAVQRIVRFYEEQLQLAQAKSQQCAESVNQRYAEHIRKADQQVQVLHTEAANRREADYQNYCAQMNVIRAADDFSQLASRFATLKDYKDSPARQQECSQYATYLYAQLIVTEYYDYVSLEQAIAQLDAMQNYRNSKTLAQTGRDRLAKLKAEEQEQVDKIQRREAEAAAQQKENEKAFEAFLQSKKRKTIKRWIITVSVFLVIAISIIVVHRIANNALNDYAADLPGSVYLYSDPHYGHNETEYTVLVFCDDETCTLQRFTYDETNQTLYHDQKEEYEYTVKYNITGTKYISIGDVLYEVRQNNDLSYNYDTFKQQEKCSRCGREIDENCVAFPPNLFCDQDCARRYLSESNPQN